MQSINIYSSPLRGRVRAAVITVKPFRTNVMNNDHGSGYLWRDLTWVYPYTTFHLLVEEDFIRLTFQIIITNTLHAFDFT